MQYFRLNFLEAPLEEGDAYARYPLVRCATCGLPSAPSWHEFAVEDDWVAQADFLSWGPPSIPMAEAAGILLAQHDLAAKIRAAGLTGFETAPATVALMDDPATPLPGFLWMKITGRCITNDVHTRRTSLCSACGRWQEESFYQPTRSVRLIEPLPITDFSRAREPIVGIIVSERFRDLFASHSPGFEPHLEFKPV